MHSKPFIEPIRKPRSKKKYQLKKHQRIARTLHTRMVQFEGRLFLVSSMVKVEKLNALLLGMSDWSQCDKDTFLSAYGCDGELTVQLLNQISASLDYWSRALLSKRSSSDSVLDRKRQHHEVEYLRVRLKFAYDSVKIPRCHPTNFLLDPSQEQQFRSETQHWEHVYPATKLDPRHRQLGRFIYWEGGKKQLQRFLVAMLCTTSPETQLVRQIDSFVKWCDILLKRWPDEQRWVVAFEFKANKAFQEFLKMAKQKSLLPAITKAEFPHRIQAHRESLMKMREQLISNRDVGFPSAVAAWAISSWRGDRLPVDTVQALRDKMSSSEAMKFVMDYVRVSRHPGYEVAVDALMRRDPLTPRATLYRASAWAFRGNSIEDIEFCIDNFDPTNIHFDICLAKLRHSAERSMRLFGEKQPTLFSLLHGNFRSDFQIELIDTIFRWLEKFPALNLNRQTRKTVYANLSNLCQLLGYKSARDTFGERIRDWFSKVNAVADCFPDESSYPKQLRIWLRRLGYYQRLTSSEVSLPKSLRKSLMAGEKRQKEIRFLKSQVDNGTATLKVRERLTHLSESEVDEGKNQRKNLRDAQEACMAVGLEALRKMMVREAARVWTKATNQPVPESWSDTRIAEVGDWIRHMSGQQLGFLRKMLQAYVIHGAEYKSALPFNFNWIARMRSQGFAIDHWLFPDRKLTKVNEREVVICVETNPYETFMMGNYFGTCLSQGGCNQMAVIANAADANKQVVYVRDRKGTVLSRQLIAINRKGQLLHYCLYIANKEVVGESCFEDFRVVVDGYCRDLATRVGLKLGDTGAPGSLGNQFWYDDGAEEWQELPKSPVEKTKPVKCSGPVPQASFALQAGFNWPAVSCTQANYEYVQPRYQIEVQ